MQKLFDSELKVMELIWAHEPISAKELSVLADQEFGWNKIKEWGEWHPFNPDFYWEKSMSFTPYKTRLKGVNKMMALFMIAAMMFAIVAIA